MKKKSEELDIEIYNEDQKWWAVLRDNATASQQSLENSLKLQKEMVKWAEDKIIEFSTK